MRAPGADGPPLRAVLFDLDDTLLNWREAEHGAIGDLVERHLAALGLEEPVCREVYAGVMEENFRAFQKTRQWWFVGDRLRLLGERLGIADRVATQVLVDSFTECVRSRMALLDGALEALAAARQGRRTALLTNGPAAVQRPKLERFGLADRVDGVFISGETGVWKPEPEAFLRALGYLGVQPQEALMVGDSLMFDIEPAKALGMRTAWMDPQARTSPHADVVVATPRELMPHLAAGG